MNRSFLLLSCAIAALALLILAFPSWYFWGWVAVASLAIFSMFESLFLLERALNKISLKPWGRTVGALVIIGTTCFMVLLSKMPPPRADLTVLVTVSAICAIGVGSWIWSLAKWLKVVRERREMPGSESVHP